MPELKRILKWISRDWWVVRRMRWPYSGYGTYNPRKRTILDSGLTKEEAMEICVGLNARS